MFSFIAFVILSADYLIAAPIPAASPFTDPNANLVVSHSGALFQVDNTTAKASLWISIGIAVLTAFFPRYSHRTCSNDGIIEQVDLPVSSCQVRAYLVDHSVVTPPCLAGLHHALVSHREQQRLARYPRTVFNILSHNCTVYVTCLGQLALHPQ